MIYEIANPSDAYTIVSDDKALVCVAVLLLGEGAYGLRDENGEDPGLPFFILGGDPERWFKEEYGIDLDEFMKGNRLRLAACLDTVLIGSVNDRKETEALLSRIPDATEREKALAERHDIKRSSMNDIGGYAKDLATALRRKKAARATGAETEGRSHERRE